MSNSPVPTGVGVSFSPVKIASVATSTFSFGPGMAIITFQPVNPNDPGVVTLYDSSGNAIFTMDREGYATEMVPEGGKSYYFGATKGANLLAMTQPSLWR